MGWNDRVTPEEAARILGAEVVKPNTPRRPDPTVPNIAMCKMCGDWAVVAAVEEDDSLTLYCDPCKPSGRKLVGVLWKDGTGAVNLSALAYDLAKAGEGLAAQRLASLIGIRLHGLPF